MTKRMLIDATQPEETRVALMDNDRLDSYDFDSAARKQIKGNIFLAKVTRVEPSLQACFVEYGGNRQGFLAFTEIHPDYYRIPVEDRQALLAEEAAAWDNDDGEDDSDLGESQASAALLDTDELEASVQAEFNSGLDEHADLADGEMPEAANLIEIERDNTIDSIGGEEEDVSQSRNARRIGRLRRRYKIQEVIKRRQIMLVQATKEERGQKGAAMTTYISLPGRYCVLMPNSPRGGGVSRKITDPQARRKMKDLLSELEVPQGMSVILRTAGMTRSRIEVKKDLEYLLRLWDEIRRETMQSEAPALIYEEADIFKRVIRDLYSRDTMEIIVAGDQGFVKTKQFMRQMVPAHAKRVLFYRDPLIPLFQRFNVEPQIADVFNPRVELKSGGYIIINPTEALVSIDVNSGRATRERHIDDTALKTNMEAAEEIARQLRLRDLGGLVVIDFIDMESGRHNAKVERKLREAMSEDRARIEIGRISGFGLLELSRQRLHPSLTETHFETCVHCAGTGLTRATESAAVVVMRAIEAEAVKGRAINITANIPQSVAIYLLNFKREDIIRIEELFGVRVALRADENMMPNDMNITFDKGTPTPKQKPEMLPVPILEGNDDDFINAEDEDDGEPLMSGGFDVEEKDGGRSGRNRNRRSNGRNKPRGESRGERTSETGGDREPREDRAPREPREPRERRSRQPRNASEGDVVNIPITTGEGTAPEAIQNPSEQGDRKPRNRRGRHPYRRRREGGAPNEPRTEGGNDKPREAREPREPREPRGEQRPPAAAKATPANDTKVAEKPAKKKAWWQALIE
jgi:ribonuclease E